MLRRADPYTDYIAVVLGVLLLSSAPAGARHTGPWRTFKHDLMRTGRSEIVGAQTGAIQWMHPLENFGIQSDIVIAGDGTIYVGSVHGDFYAFRPDGSIKWQHRLSRRQITAAPALMRDGTIVIASEDGTLRALSPRKGKEIWRYDLQAYAGPSSSPVIGTDGTIYVSAAKLFALHPDGTLAWAYDTGARIEGPAAIAPNGTLYFPSQGYLYALDKHGALKWRVQRHARYSPGSAPAIAEDGTIYINTYDATLQAFHPDGTLAWTFKTSGIVNDVPSSPAIGADGTIYFGGGGEYQDRGGFFYALNPDGSLKWKFFAGCAQTAPSIGGDGAIYFGSNWCGSIRALNPDGTVKWSYPNIYDYARTAPVIGADGTVYAGLLGGPTTPDKGGLIAFGP